MKSSLRVRIVVVALTSLAIVAGITATACSSTPTVKTCTTEEVKKCDDQLNQCLLVAPCDDATNPGFKACTDSCSKKNCDCQSACGNTCK